MGDARAVTKVLSSDYGFESKMLLNATRADIIDALAALRGRLTANDNLLIYFAGHGVLDSYAEEGYWLPVDAKKNSPANWISNDDVTNMLRALRARHVMVVADSCFSGTLVRTAPVRIKTAAERNIWLKRMVKRRSRTALVSGGLEPVLDAGGGAHSVFAKAFLEALSENSGVLEGQTLFSRLKRPVALESDQTPQYSDIRRAGHDGGEFLFVRRSSLSGAGSATAKPAPPAKPTFDARAADLAFWNSIKGGTDPAVFEAYLQQFPKGIFAALARMKLNSLGTAKKAQAKAREEARRKALEEAQAKAAAEARAKLEAEARARAEAEEEHRKAVAVARRQAEIEARAQAEEQLWRSVSQSTDPASFQTYLAAYPAGRFAQLALARSQQLRKQAAEEKARRESEAERQRAEAEELRRRQQLAAIEQPRSTPKPATTTRKTVTLAPQPVPVKKKSEAAPKVAALDPDEQRPRKQSADEVFAFEQIVANWKADLGSDYVTGTTTVLIRRFQVRGKLARCGYFVKGDGLAQPMEAGWISGAEIYLGTKNKIGARFIRGLNQALSPDERRAWCNKFAVSTSIAWSDRIKTTRMEIDGPVHRDSF